MFSTVNYLFAAYLQTSEGGRHKIAKVEKIRPGKARFFFDISLAKGDELQIKFHNSICSEFEQMRKSTIDLSW